MVCQLGCELLFVGADKRWPVLGNYTLHSVRQDRLEVGKMADDLKRAPFARDRACSKLLATHPRNSLAKCLCSCQILLNQLCKCGHDALQ